MPFSAPVLIRSSGQFVNQSVSVGNVHGLQFFELDEQLPGFADVMPIAFQFGHYLPLSHNVSLAKSYMALCSTEMLNDHLSVQSRHSPTLCLHTGDRRSAQKRY